MSITDLHYLGGIKLPSCAFISELTDLSPQNNHTFLVGFAAGHPFPLFQSVAGSKPEIQFSTPQLKKFLDVAGVLGFDASAGNTDFFFRRGKNLGARHDNSGGNHKRLRVTAGYLYWTELMADYQQAATVRGRYKPISSDGESLPYTPAGSINLSDVPVADEYYTLSEVYLGGSFFLRGLKSVRFSLNPRMTEDGANDDIFDTYCGMDQVDPQITFDGLSWQYWLENGLIGRASDAWDIYLRKKLIDGHHVAKNVAQHIRISGSGGLSVVAGTSGGDNNPARTSVTMRIRAADGQESTNLFTINTASVIPI